MEAEIKKLDPKIAQLTAEITRIVDEHPDLFDQFGQSTTEFRVVSDAMGVQAAIAATQEKASPDNKTD